MNIYPSNEIIGSLEPAYRKALQQPPKFGNVAQIRALKQLRSIMDAECEEREEREREGLQHFSVTITFSCEETVKVWAKNEEDARRKAREEIDPDDFDTDYYVRKLDA